MKELIVANNMVALARGRKHSKPNKTKMKSAGQKRSAMLKMIMPFLSRETGEKLAMAIDQRSTSKFSSIWEQVRKEIVQKLESTKPKHLATASSCCRFSKEEAEVICAMMKWAMSRLCDDSLKPCPVPPAEHGCNKVSKEDTVPGPIYNPNVPSPLSDYANLADVYRAMVASSNK